MAKASLIKAFREPHRGHCKVQAAGTSELSWEQPVPEGSLTRGRGEGRRSARPSQGDPLRREFRHYGGMVTQVQRCYGMIEDPAPTQSLQ